MGRYVYERNDAAPSQLGWRQHVGESGHWNHGLAAFCCLNLSQAFHNALRYFLCFIHAGTGYLEGYILVQGHPIYKPSFLLKGSQLSGCQDRGWMGAGANTQLWFLPSTCSQHLLLEELQNSTGCGGSTFLATDCARLAGRRCTLRFSRKPGRPATV